MKGVTIIRLGYHADPEKQDPRWKDAMKTGFTDAAWDKEFEGVANAGLGLAIYAREYKPEKHERPLRIDPRLPLLHGWDFGLGWPAHVWFQRTIFSGVRIIASKFAEQMQLRPFAGICVAYEINELGGPYPNRRDFCDPAGNQGKDDGLKSIKVLEEFNYHPKWRGSEYTERHNHVSGLLLGDQLDGEPTFLIDPEKNPQLCEAFRTYYRRNPQGEPTREHPYIDLMNALEYGLVNTKNPPRKAPPRPDLSWMDPVSGYGRPPMVTR